MIVSEQIVMVWVRFMNKAIEIGEVITTHCKYSLGQN